MDAGCQVFRSLWVCLGVGSRVQGSGILAFRYEGLMPLLYVRFLWWEAWQFRVYRALAS